MHKYRFYSPEMHCGSCEIFLQTMLSEHKDVASVNASLADNSVEVVTKKEEDKKKLLTDLNRILKDSTYTLQIHKANKIANKEFFVSLIVSLLIISMFLLITGSRTVEAFTFENITLPVVFVIGLLASISSCMAVVGSIVLTFSSHYAKNFVGNKLTPTLSFHISRIVTFFVLGGFLGLAGSVFKLSYQLTSIVNIILAIILLILGITLVEVLPFASKLQLAFPKDLVAKFINTRYGKTFTPLVLGFITFFLPCGFTQAMQFYAVTLGSFIQGALAMLVFSLGTFPMLFLISFVSIKFSKSIYAKILFKTAGFLIIFFALYNLYGGLVVLQFIEPL